MKQDENYKHTLFSLKLASAVLSLTASVGCLAAGPTFTVDASHPAGKVSPALYGLMTEEINHSYDGGLYAELIQNRAFLDSAATPVHWSAVNGKDSAATIALDPTNSINDKLATSLRLTVAQAAKRHPAGVANSGYWGIPVLPKATYRATILAKADSNFSGPATVSIVSDDGRTVFATKSFSGLTTDWKKFELTLKTGRVSPTAKARFAITLDQPGTAWLGLASLFPPTWNNHPTGGKVSNQDFFFHPHPARDKGRVTVQLKDLPPGKYGLAVHQIGYGLNDPYSRYLEPGQPVDLSREAVAGLKKISNGNPVSKTTVTVKADGLFETTLPLRENDVFLLSLVPEKQTLI